MSKRHFEWAAEYVRTSPPEIRQALVHAFLDLFIEFGPNFDRQRFERACGVE